MQALRFTQVKTVDAAVDPDGRFVAGGTTLIDLMKLNVETPKSLIDINLLPFLGAMVMGIGMGMLEETIYDPRNAKPLNNNYADYLVATNADIPEQECIFLNYPDPVIGEYGARGIGEIGLVGVASALTMATYHATCIRVRELPIRVEKLMESRVV